MKRFAHLFPYILVVCFFIQSCATSESKQDGEATMTRIDGSSTVYPITKTIVDSYKSKNRGAKIEINVSGTGGGFNKFAENQIDICNASRKISESEKEMCQSKNVQFQEIKIGFDGIAIVVNKENDWLTDLTIEELNGIWKKDGYKKWSEVRNGWPEEDIALYGPGEASGTYDYFKEAILKEADEMLENFRKSENDNLLVQGISNNLYGLGFFGASYYENNKDKLKVLAINNGSGAVIPTTTTISTGEYQPLARPIFIYVNSSFLQTDQGREFINFYLENVPAAAKNVGAVPLSEQEYKTELLKLKKGV